MKMVYLPESIQLVYGVLGAKDSFERMWTAARQQDSMLLRNLDWVVTLRRLLVLSGPLTIIWSTLVMTKLRETVQPSFALNSHFVPVFERPEGESNFEKDVVNVYGSLPALTVDSFR